MTTHLANELGLTLVPYTNNLNPISFSPGNHINAYSSYNILNIWHGVLHFPKDDGSTSISNKANNPEGNEPSQGPGVSHYHEDNELTQIFNKVNYPEGNDLEQYSSSNKEPSEKKELSSSSCSNEVNYTDIRKNKKPSELYRSIVDDMQYVTLTMPDAHSVSTKSVSLWLVLLTLIGQQLEDYFDIWVVQWNMVCCYLLVFQLPTFLLKHIMTLTVALKSSLWWHVPAQKHNIGLLLTQHLNCSD